MNKRSSITIAGNNHRVDCGLVTAEEICELAGNPVGRLYVSRPDDIDIPLDNADLLIVQGGEEFVIGDSPIDDNPLVRVPLRVRFNGSDGIELSKAKFTGLELKRYDEAFPNGRLFAEFDCGPDIEIADDVTIVVLEGNSFIVVPAAEGSGAGDPIDIEQCGRHDRHPPKGQTYRIRIDRQKFVVDKGQIVGEAILALVGKSTDEWALNQKFGGGKRERIEAGDLVDLTRPGVERFETVRRQAQQGHERFP